MSVHNPGGASLPFVTTVTAANALTTILSTVITTITERATAMQTIQEAADELQVSHSTVRSWADKFGFTTRDHKGRRAFNPDEMSVFYSAKAMLGEGRTLNTVQRRLVPARVTEGSESAAATEITTAPATVPTVTPAMVAEAVGEIMREVMAEERARIERDAQEKLLEVGKLNGKMQERCENQAARIAELESQVRQLAAPKEKPRWWNWKVF